MLNITKKGDIKLGQKIKIRLLCVLAAILISYIFVYLVSAIGCKNPIKAFGISFDAIGALFRGTFKNTYSLKSFLREFTILLGISLALIPAYKMKFWNVGAQGQILMGALMASIIMIYCNQLPNGVLITVMLLGAILVGALWGVIPAVFKALFNSNETLFTLMMNYIAIQFVVFATENWRGEKSAPNIFNMGTKKGWLPTLGDPIVLPLVFVLLLMVGIYFYLEKSKHGYEIKVVGESENTARYAGINVKWVTIRTLIISGALCGIIGFFYVSGFDHIISKNTSGSYGFTAIIACWLGAFNPFIMPLYSFIICFLNAGAKNIQSEHISPMLNSYSSEVIILVVILAIMIGEFLTLYNVKFKKKKEIENKEVVE